MRLTGDISSMLLQIVPGLHACIGIHTHSMYTCTIIKHRLGIERHTKTYCGLGTYSQGSPQKTKVEWHIDHGINNS